MKKIGIITLNGYHNYGNRLQNYATQEVLKSLGFFVETFLVKKINNKKQNNKKIWIKIPTKILSFLKSGSIRKMKKRRYNVFKTFTLNYIAETNFAITEKYIPDTLKDEYDYFITGSDQVWNPNYPEVSHIHFLTFAPKYKRIAFAPSFGVSKINPEYVDNYKKWISDIHRLSVREKDGARIIKELTGRDAVVLVDPTLLLTKEKWLSIAKESKNKPKSRFLLTYFLGEMPSKYRKQINKIAADNNLTVVNLNDIRDEKTYVIGPNEFIDYINSCSLLCTDSFHGTVFSILYEKPFIVYKRVGSSFSMYSRIETLLNKFDLNSRKAENIKTNEDVFNIDYSHVPPILEKERNKALKFKKKH